MKKIIINILFIVYLIMTILVTQTLLSYNKYNISESNNHYLTTISENTAGIKKSDLLLIQKSDNLKENEYVFYYDTYAAKTIVKIAKIKKIESSDDKEIAVVLDNEIILSSENILGTKAETTTYPLLGTAYNVLTSKWGYLIIIILPMLVAFFCEIYEITKEIKKK